MSQHADSVVPGRRRRLVAALAGLVLAVPLAVVATAAQAVTPQAVGLRFDTVADHASGFPAPVKGQPFDVTVTSVDVNGVPTPVNKSTPISLSVVTGSGTLSGTVTGSIPKNSSTGTISGAVYSAFGNATVFAVSSSQLSGTTFTVDVQALLTFQATKPGKSAKLVTCAAMTETQPTCATLLLPNGAASTQTTLTEQDCAFGFSCRAAGSVKSLLVQGFADFGDLYSRSAPATLIVGCDKSLCGNGGVKDFNLLAQLKNDPAPQIAPDCPSKGQISPDLSTPAFCVDRVQSTRDNAGDLLLYLLFDDDLRGSNP
jgi:hypothetical protein